MDSSGQCETGLKEARYNGHLLFINSGRTYTMIPEIIKEMDSTAMYADAAARFI